MRGWVVAIVLAAFLPEWSVAQGSKRVLVVNSYHAEYAWVMDYSLGLPQGLGPEVRLDFFEMDTKRRPQESSSKKSSLTMWRLFQPMQKVVQATMTLKSSIRE